jgi:hypothetical protein
MRAVVKGVYSADAAGEPSAADRGPPAWQPARVGRRPQPTIFG